MEFDPESIVSAALASLPTTEPTPTTPPEVPDTTFDSCTDFDIELDASLLISLHVKESCEPQHSEESLNGTVCPGFEHSFRQNMCDHIECDISGAVSMAIAFNKMDRVARVGFVRSMLFAIASPPQTVNTLFKDSTVATRKRSRKNKELGTAPSRVTTAFSIKGQRLCLQAFAAITQLSAATISRHAKDVSGEATPDIYKTLHGTCRKAKSGVQRVVVHAYLMSVASDFGMECPRGRGSQDESPLLLLPSSFTKTSVYYTYKEKWQGLFQAFLEFRADKVRPVAPVHFNLFIRYWAVDMPTLHIASLGSDFCDTCTTLKNSLESLEESDIRYDTTREVLQRHLHDSKSEFHTYKACQNECNSARSGNVNHFVFDFAEKVLLPKLEKQPGQLHFITGLKFDFLGVSSSNALRNYVFGLPEGHWPNEKTANTVISMLDYIITHTKKEGNCTEHGRHLKLHPDNCAGQNKNRYVLWYLTWRVLVGLENEITLYFLVAGHTKNVCDGAFGHIKRTLLTFDVRSPAEMMAVIEKSSHSTTCVPSCHVYWRNWKELLEQYFTIPKNCRNSQGHVFHFSSSEPWKLRMKTLTTSSDDSVFSLKKRGLPDIAVQFSYNNDVLSTMFDAKISSLKEVYSKNHDTRQNYLKVNILDRYYEHDEPLRHAFFEDGSREISRLS